MKRCLRTLHGKIDTEPLSANSLKLSTTQQLVTSHLAGYIALNPLWINTLLSLDRLCF